MPASNSHSNPYVGPRSFQTGETLYGRDYELRQLLDLLIAERIVLLHSPSGAGKSSLIQAGLVPRLLEEGFRVLPPVRVNLEPPAELRDEPYFNRYTFSALISLQEVLPDEQRIAPKKMAIMTLEEFLAKVPAQTGASPENGASNEIIIFDQFEEILTVAPTQIKEKTVFFNQVGAALRQRNRWALFSMREDYLAALNPYLRPIPTRFGNTFRLDFLGKEAACQAIQFPARRAEVDFTDEAVQKLVDDLRKVQVQQPDGTMEEQFGPYVEPVQLQVVCYRLWEHLPTSARQILTSDIETVGDVDAALADYYAERVAEVAAQTGASQRTIRDWFEHQLITPQGIRGQVLMGKEQSGDLDNRAIRLLENAHLLRAEKRGGAIWFELAHDRLIGPVRKNNAAWFQTHLTLFQRQAALWALEKRPDSLLLRDLELEQAEAWTLAHASELTDLERSFLEACQELRNRELEAKKLVEAQQVAETERQRAEIQARSARQLRRLATIIAAALVLAIITTVLAGFYWQQSKLAADFNQALASTNGVIAAENAVYASTNQAIASTAQSASTLAVAQQRTAEAASTQENFQRRTAEAASSLADAQRATAQFNAEIASRNEDLASQQARIAFSRQLASQSLSYLSSRPEISLLLGIEAYRTSDTLEAKSALLTGLQRALSQTVNRFGRPVPPETTTVTSVAISPQGDRMAFGNADGDIIVWNYTRGEIEDRYTGHAGIVWGLAFSPDGMVLASAGNDSVILLWNISSREKTSLRNINKVLSVSWSPSGDRLAAAVGPHVVIWDIADSKAPVIDQNLLVDVNAVSWSPDGALVAAATSFPNVALLDPNTGVVQQTFAGHTGKVKSVAWSPDSKLVASGGADNIAIVYDVEKGERLGEPLKSHWNEVLGVSFSYDNNILATGSKDGSIILWNVKTLLPFGLPITSHTSDVNGLAFIQGSGPTLLASASRDKTAQLQEVITQQPLREALAPINGEVMSLTAEPSGALLAVGRQGTSISLWNVQAGSQSPALRPPEAIAGTVLSEDGQSIAVWYESGAISILDAVTGLPRTLIQEPEGRVIGLALSPDGQILASSHCIKSARSGDQTICEQNEIWLWNTATGEAKGQPLQAQQDFILALAFSPDGSQLASASADKTIWLWEIETGKPLGLPLARHLDRVTSLAFSPDGKILASSSADNTLILWDVATNQPIGEPLLGSPGSATSLVFSQDSKFLYSGYTDGSVLRWDIDFEAWIQRACGLAGGNLAPSEWDQFFRFQDQVYRKTCEQFPLGNQTATPAP